MRYIFWAIVVFTNGVFLRARIGKKQLTA